MEQTSKKREYIIVLKKQVKLELKKKGDCTLNGTCSKKKGASFQKKKTARRKEIEKTQIEENIVLRKQK